ncbi:hypothetical protein ACX801_07095 [Arthrobacter bambusae]
MSQLDARQVHKFPVPVVVRQLASEQAEEDRPLLQGRLAVVDDPGQEVVGIHVRGQVLAESPEPVQLLAVVDPHGFKLPAGAVEAHQVRGSA